MTADEFVELLNSETDTFRLAIRGHAAIDAKLDEILEDAFVEGMPQFLRGPSFGRKLEMVVALGLVPASFRDAIAPLTRLRNEFSHGKMVELDAARARGLLVALGGVAPALKEAKLPADPRGVLIVALGISWFGLVTCEQAARKHREDVKAALARAQLGGSEIAYILGEAARREPEDVAVREASDEPPRVGEDA